MARTEKETPRRSAPPTTADGQLPRVAPPRKRPLLLAAAVALLAAWLAFLLFMAVRG